MSLNQMPPKPSDRDLSQSERRVYSQNGEDGVIEAIFASIGASDQLYVEIGCDDGAECNTRYLRGKGWKGWMFDAVNENKSIGLTRARVDRSNISTLLDTHKVPHKFDLLSLDIDFNDFHVLDAILRVRQPRVIVVEHNSSFGMQADAVVPYLPNWSWDGTRWFGASLKALCNLGKRYNYDAIYVESQGVNLFLVKTDEWGDLPRPCLEDLYRPPQYGPQGNGHPFDQLKRPVLSSEHYLLNGVHRAETRFGVINFLANDEYIGRAFLNGGYWEQHELQQISQKLAPLNGTGLDIGAHIGSHAIALAHECQNIRFLCFEPQRVLRILLERNVNENMLWHKIKIFGKALSYKTGNVCLSGRFSDGSSADQPLSYDSSSPANYGGVQLGVDGESLEALSIDEIDCDDIIYMKVDVEGAERLVFHGGKRLIEREKPIIVFENRDDRMLSEQTLNMLMVPNEIRSFDISAFLNSLNYNLTPLGQAFLALPPKREHGHTASYEPNTRIPATSQLNYHTIPPILFQTWKTRINLPPIFALCRESFESMSPNFAKPLWGDSDNREFVKRNFDWFLSVYNSYSAEIYRADSIRYFFLYAFGGVYADLDVMCLQPLEALTSSRMVLLGRMGTNTSMPHSIPNAIMASPARHPFWLLVIALMMQAVKQNPKGRPEYLTGPVILKQAHDIWTNNSTQARQLIQAIVAKLPPQLEPGEESTVKVLEGYHWFPFDWTDPFHQKFRQGMISQKQHPSIQQCKRLFPNSQMTTFWSHSW